MEGWQARWLCLYSAGVSEYGDIIGYELPQCLMFDLSLVSALAASRDGILRYIVVIHKMTEKKPSAVCWDVAVRRKLSRRSLF